MGADMQTEQENCWAISGQIKKYRGSLKLSQEELAEKVYVSRQSISNWENGKNYPDIHSLLLLSTLFNVSLDQLMKGDIEMMEQEIKEAEIQKLNRCSMIYAILLVATVVSAVPLASWLGLYAFIPWGILFAVTMFFALKAERIKKENDIYTFKEITAFMQGRRLDEIEQWQEQGKRPYQKVLLALFCGIAALLICLVLGYIFI